MTEFWIWDIYEITSFPSRSQCYTNIRNIQYKYVMYIVYLYKQIRCSFSMILLLLLQNILRENIIVNRDKILQNGSF